MRALFMLGLYLLLNTNSAAEFESPPYPIKDIRQSGILHYARIWVGEEDALELLVSYQRGEELLRVFHEGADQPFLTYRRSSTLDGFMLAELMRAEQIGQEHFLITKWRRGVHGQSVLIHSLSSGKQVYERNFLWPVLLTKQRRMLHMETGRDTEPLSWRPDDR